MPIVLWNNLTCCIHLAITCRNEARQCCWKMSGPFDQAFFMRINFVNLDRLLE